MKLNASENQLLKKVLNRIRNIKIMQGLKQEPLRYQRDNYLDGSAMSFRQLIKDSHTIGGKNKGQEEKKEAQKKHGLAVQKELQATDEKLSVN